MSLLPYPKLQSLSNQGLLWQRGSLVTNLILKAVELDIRDFAIGKWLPVLSTRVAMDVQICRHTAVIEATEPDTVDFQPSVEPVGPLK